MLNSDCDLERFRLPSQVFKNPPSAPRVIPVQRSGEWFIRGPLPGAWLLQADQLPGKYNLRVALAIQYVHGLRKGSPIILDRFHFDRFGVKKDSARRALERLKEAGLIDYVKAGQKFRVTILDCEVREVP